MKRKQRDEKEKRQRRSANELARLTKQAEEMLRQGFVPQEVANLTKLTLQKVFEIKILACEAERLSPASRSKVMVRAGSRFGNFIVEMLGVEPDSFLEIASVEGKVIIRPHTTNQGEESHAQ